MVIGNVPGGPQSQRMTLPRILFSTCAVTLVALTTATAARAAGPVPALRAVGPIKNDLGKCLDPGALPLFATDPATIWSCHNGDNQGWYYDMQGLIRNMEDPSLCLGVQGGLVSTARRVRVYTCDGVGDQIWVLTDEGEFRNGSNDNYCLDVYKAINTNGNYLQTWGCNGTPAQKWRVTELPWAPVFSGVADDRCLDVAGASSGSGENVISWSCHEGNNQKWILTGDGEVRAGVAANRCLDVQGGEFTNGTNVWSYKCNGTEAQQWVATPKGELRSLHHPEFCLDIASGDQNIGVNVQLWSCNGTTAQQWNSSGFVRVGARVIGGHLTMARMALDEGYAITDPVTVLQMAREYGASDKDLDELESMLSPPQVAALVDAFGADFSVQEIANTQRGAATFGEAITVDGVGGEVRFAASPEKVDARVGVDLVDLDHPDFDVDVDGPEAGAVLYATSGGFQLDAGAGLISAATQTGSNDGSHLGVGVGFGVGPEVGAKWGQDGQIGFNLGLEVFSVRAYVHQRDVLKVGVAAESVALEVHDWADIAAADTEEWLNVASADAEDWVAGAADWTGTAVDDVGGALEDAIDWFIDIF